MLFRSSPLAGFEYAISPFLDRIIDGRISIPTADDLFGATPFAILGRQNYLLSNYNMKESNLYPAQGNSGIVPLLPKNLRTEERKALTERGVLLVDYKVKGSEFMRVYGENDANTYLTNVGQNWYFINNLENKQGNKYGKFTPNYASAESFYIQADEHTSAIIKDSKNGFNIYLSNYRTDKSDMIMQDSTKIFETGKWIDYVGKYLSLDRNGNPVGVSDKTLDRKSVV